MKSSDIFKSVRNFLFSRVNGEILIFLFFFAVAGVFWGLLTLNENYEQEIRVPIKYTNIPKTAVMTSSETDTFRVVVNDKGIAILTYLYGDALNGITADFNDYAAKQKAGRGEISASELTKMVTKKLPASTKIVSVKPDHLYFYYNNGEKKRVPVRWKGAVTPEDPYYLSDVEYEPDSVTIFASREALDSIHSVSTQPLEYTDFQDTLKVKATLEHCNGVKMVPEKVNISFITDILTEESIDQIPIRGINMPKGKVLRTFPAKARVKFITGMKTYKTLSPEDFTVIADYNEIKNNLSPKCQIHLKSSPDGIRMATLEYDQVDYLIEEQTILTTTP